MTEHPSWCDPARCTVVTRDTTRLLSHRGDLYRDRWGAGVVAMQNEVLEHGVAVSTCRPMLVVDVDPTQPLTPDRAADLGYALWRAQDRLRREALPCGELVLACAGGSQS